MKLAMTPPTTRAAIAPTTIVVVMPPSRRPLPEPPTFELEEMELVPIEEIGDDDDEEPYTAFVK